MAHLAARAESWKYPEFKNMGHGSRYVYEGEDLESARRRISVAARRWIGRHRPSWSIVTRLDRRSGSVYLWFIDPEDPRPVRDHLGAPIA